MDENLKALRERFPELQWQSVTHGTADQYVAGPLVVSGPWAVGGPWRSDLVSPDIALMGYQRLAAKGETPTEAVENIRALVYQLHDWVTGFLKVK